jgi:hypothetical protein
MSTVYGRLAISYPSYLFGMEGELPNFLQRLCSTPCPMSVNTPDSMALNVIHMLSQQHPASFELPRSISI